MRFLHSLFCVLRAPAGDGGEGGGGAAVAEETHGSAATALFDAPAAGGGDAAAKAVADKATADKAAADKAAAGAAKPPASPISKFGAKKPADDAAAKAAAEKAAAAAQTDEDKINLGDKASPETKTQFGELKKITKNLRAELAARDAKLAEAEKRNGSAPTTPEIEKLRAEHKAFSERLSIVDLQNHPDYVRQFGEPKTKLVTGINTVLADNKVDGADIASLVGKPRADFMKSANELAEKLPDYERPAFMADMRQLYTLEGEAKAALGKAGEVGALLQKKGEQSAKAAFEETWKSLDFGEALNPMEIPADASAEDRAALEAYNKAVGGIRTNAEQIAFGRTDERGASLTATKAATFDFLREHAIPRMEAEFAKAATLVSDLTKEIAALKAARAGGGSDGGGGNDSTAEESHAAAASKVFSR